MHYEDCQKVTCDSETVKCCGIDMQNVKLDVDAIEKKNDTQNFIPNQTVYSFIILQLLFKVISQRKF